MRGHRPAARLRSTLLLVGLIQRRILGALLVTGWAVYVTVVVASNLSDLLASFGWIHTSFRSDNLAFIGTATRIYFRSQPVDQVLLGLVIVWEAGAAVLLWFGAIVWYRSASPRMAAAETGLIVIGLLWVAFAITTEIFIAYDRGISESSFWVLAIASLVTLLVLTHFRRDPA